MGQGIFLPESTSSADSLMVSVLPPCATACITPEVTLNIPNSSSLTPLLGHKKILHTLIGMGSTALAAAVP